jgi:hypothetical protein
VLSSSPARDDFARRTECEVLGGATKNKVRSDRGAGMDITLPGLSKDARVISDNLSRHGRH